MMREEWRPVIGYEGLYEVSNKGRVRSLDRMRYDGKRSYAVRERVLKQKLNAYGYPVVSLNKSGKSKTATVHRLIANAFLENPEGKRCIDHINGVRDDNRLENLRWATHKENADNMFRLNNQVDWTDRNISDESRYRFTHSQCKAVIRNDGKRFESIKKAAEALGYRDPRQVIAHLKGRRGPVRGYTFAYAKKEAQ